MTTETQQNNTGLALKEYARIAKIIAAHRVTIDEANRELAMNCNTPAQRIINFACARMGIKRIDWEKIDAVMADTRFVAPPKHILRRWESY